MSKSESNLEAFKDKATALIERLEAVVDENLPQKGLKSEECQNVALHLALAEVQVLINGTTAADLTE